MWLDVRCKRLRLVGVLLVAWWCAIVILKIFSFLFVSISSLLSFFLAFSHLA